ncbi:hypothetical protein PUN28_006207 [Cardiocondyla obscurior]|uniref:Ribosomal protein L5 n=1 Tax=Cardiocondyla obscurior TaxID=286306 RepID=A0AAW2GCY3_9HYME
MSLTIFSRNDLGNSKYVRAELSAMLPHTRNMHFNRSIIPNHKETRVVTLSIDNVPSTFYLTRRPHSRPSPNEFALFLSHRGTNVIQKFPIAYRRRNFPGGQNSFPSIFPRFILRVLTLRNARLPNSLDPRTATRFFFLFKWQLYLSKTVTLRNIFAI